MPHFLAKKTHFPSYPFTQDGYEFCFEASSIHSQSESLIHVRFCGDGGEKTFFVRKINRAQDILFKAEKITKPQPIGILKGALRALAQKCEVIVHNLNNDSMRQVIQSKFLLSPKELIARTQKEFCIEIGFGSGRHLLKQAQLHPQTDYIGVEIHTPSIEQVLRQIELLGLQNVLIVCMDARILLEILPSNQCQAIYIHFPIPWHKSPHRRVMSQKLLTQALRVLAPNAPLELRTDDLGYFQDSLSLAMEQEVARIQAAKNLSNVVVSKYEARWQRKQKDIFDLKIFSLHHHESEKIEYDFVFDFSLPKHALTHRFEKIIKKDYFLHICDVFQSDCFWIVSVSFGDFERPLSKLIIFDILAQKIYYFGGDPLATRANIKSHQELLRLLMEER
ncbi:tRNA (guanosine(46)-N7)-methyltransferase TrmB [Helicobacter sp. 12S02634-8]|uniref:tRNA (guanosine(46)-N7)-methyltransferase TrmB n=1 Tax=Helicobacter sp. 12S02634-8 TaxID=1476199 RepID=UPI000BA57CA8|nr:tRNA (guanosine(46)-N7)-methyltransferase TrmB [Helicobacter sp. 12S02634-8]PAF47480.1 tRNA (guanosine(46)-N7)-methyltransferase TrmB [Helicobacter sp. 12S02634-8]